MSNVCPKCSSKNRAAASFCDSCGARLKPVNEANQGAKQESNGSQQKTNYGGIFIVILVIAVTGWLLFGPSGDPGTPGIAGNSDQMANPHGEQVSNPHGEAGSSGADGGDGGQMVQMGASFEEAKTSLDANPLDTESLMLLYESFGMIGRQDKIRPRLDAAVDALVAKVDEVDSDELCGILREITFAALYGNDLDGAEYALVTVGNAAPGNSDIEALRAEVDAILGGSAGGTSSNPHGGMDMSGGNQGTMPNPHGGGEAKPDSDE